MSNTYEKDISNIKRRIREASESLTGLEGSKILKKREINFFIRKIIFSIIVGYIESNTEEAENENDFSVQGEMPKLHSGVFLRSFKMSRNNLRRFTMVNTASAFGYDYGRFLESGEGYKFAREPLHMSWRENRAVIETLLMEVTSDLIKKAVAQAFKLNFVRDVKSKKGFFGRLDKRMTAVFNRGRGADVTSYAYNSGSGRKASYIKKLQKSGGL